MTKTELKTRTDAAVSATREALQTVYDALNHGQKMKIVKDERVKALFDRYGVKTEETA